MGSDPTPHFFVANDEAVGLRLNKTKEVCRKMHFGILGFRNDSRCEVEVVKADTINIKRNLSKIFTFKEPERFMEVLQGHSEVAVYVGKEANGTENPENWRAYYIEPSDPSKDSYSYSRNILPLGTLAILEMETEYDLEWALERKAKEAVTYVDLFRQIHEITAKISRINRDHPYADADQFGHMTPEELEKTLKDVEEAYRKLAQQGDVEL